MNLVSLIHKNAKIVQPISGKLLLLILSIGHIDFDLITGYALQMPPII